MSYQDYIEGTKNPFQAGKIVGTSINPDDYHRPNSERGKMDLAVGRSDLMEILCNPHRWRMGYQRKSSEAMDWGNLMDCKVMTPQQFKTVYAVKPKEYPDEKGQMKPWHGGSTWCKQWLKDHADKIPVSTEDHLASNQALEVLYQDEEAREFIKVSAKQVMVMAVYKTVYVDPRTKAETKVEIPVKILIDLLPDAGHPKFGKCIGDFKSSCNAHPFPWTRDFKKYGYMEQAAFYLDVYSSVVPQERDQFRHIILESEFPWEVGKRVVGEGFLRLGRRRYLEALELYAECLATNQWPNYEREMPGRLIIDGWLVVTPEPWMEND